MTAVLLPHKLSELAQIALDDVEAVQLRADKYKVNFNHWFESRGNGTCVVCAAGAVMANRLGCHESVVSAYTFVERFGVSNTAALLAIDMLRRGWVGHALAVLASEYPADEWSHVFGIDGHELSIDLEWHDDASREWRLAMQSLISRLKAAGL